MNRITETFSYARKANRKGLVTFVMGGDPDLETTLAALHAMAEAGADIIECGMPFSDPMADGPAIQKAGIRALASGTTLKNILAMIAKFRATNTKTPIVLMGYYNPLLAYGVEAFMRDAAKAGVDGLIIVDLPPEEDALAYAVAEAQNIAWIRLIAPTTDEARLKALVTRASGFIYYVSVAGVTGTKSADMASIEKALARIRTYSDLPIVVGFGVKTPEQAKQVAAVADAVVVGSAIVEKFEKFSARMLTDVAAFVRDLKAGVC